MGSVRRHVCRSGCSICLPHVCEIHEWRLCDGRDEGAVWRVPAVCGGLRERVSGYGHLAVPMAEA